MEKMEKNIDSEYLRILDHVTKKFPASAKANIRKAVAALFDYLGVEKSGKAFEHMLSQNGFAIARPEGYDSYAVWYNIRNYRYASDKNILILADTLEILPWR